MKKSLLRNTLCAIVLATVTLNVDAQKKPTDTKINNETKSEYFDALSDLSYQVPKKDSIIVTKKNRFPEFARFGISLGPEYNPKVSVGIRLGPRRSDDGFAPYLDVAYYPANTPIKRFSKEINNYGQLPPIYIASIYSIPRVQVSAYASNRKYTFGAGLALIRKELRGVPWHHDIHSRQLSLSLRAGIHLNAIFPNLNLPLEIEGGVGYFRKTDMTYDSWSKTVTKNVREQISTMDKDFFSFDVGFVYWLK